MNKVITHDFLSFLENLLIHDRILKLQERGDGLGLENENDNKRSVLEVLQDVETTLPRIHVPPHKFFHVATLPGSDYRNHAGETAEEINKRYMRHANCQIALRANTGAALVDGGVLTSLSEEETEELVNSYNQVWRDWVGLSPDDEIPEDARTVIQPQYLSIPGVLRMFEIGAAGVYAGVPETIDSGGFFEIRSELGRLVVHPTAGEGAFDMGWSRASQGLLMTLKPDIPSVQSSSGLLGRWASLTTRIRDAEAAMLLRPRLTGGRILWDLGTSLTARIDEDRHGAVTGSSPLVRRMLVEDRFDGDLPNVNDDGFFDRWITDPYEDGLSEGINSAIDTVEEALRFDLALPELAGNALSALPLRPDDSWAGTPGNVLSMEIVPKLLPALSEFNDQLKAKIGSKLMGMAEQSGAVYTLGSSIRLYHLLLLLPYEDDDFSLRDVAGRMAAGLQSIANLTPFNSLKESVEFVGDLLLNVMRDAASSPGLANRRGLPLQDIDTPEGTIRGLTEHEAEALVGEVFVRKLAESVLNRLELAHIGDRSELVSTLKVVEAGEAEPQLLIESAPLLEKAGIKRLRTMQYRLRLSQFDLDDEPLPEGAERTLVVRYGAVSRHDAIRRDRGAEVLEERMVRISLPNETGSFPRDASHMMLLELPTADHDAHLDMSVSAVMEVRAPDTQEITRTNLGTLEFTIDLDRNSGLNAGAGRRPANAFSFTHTPDRNDRFKGQRAFTVHGRLEQLPMSQRFEKLRVSVLAYSLSGLPKIGIKPTTQGFHYRLSAWLNNGLLGREEQRVSSEPSHPSHTRAVLATNTSALLAPEWDGYVTYDADEAGRTDEFFDLAFDLEFNGESHRFGHRVHRFSKNGVAAEVAAGELGAIDSGIERASDLGADARWGIEMGHNSNVLTLTSDDGLYSVQVLISRDRFAPEDTPPERAPIRAGFTLESMRIHDDLDPEGGAGEMRFWPSCWGSWDGENDPRTESQSYGSISRNVQSNRTYPINRRARFMTLSSKGGTIHFECTSKEEDVFSDDKPGTVTITQEITNESRNLAPITGRARGGERAFSMTVQPVVSARPTTPLLRFANLPRGMSTLQSAAGVPVQLEFACTFCDRVKLVQIANGQERVIEEVSGAGRGSFRVAPRVRTVYRVIAERDGDDGTAFARSSDVTILI